MAIEFREVSYAPIAKLSVIAPRGVVIGVVGESGAGVEELLKLAAGLVKPMAGAIQGGERRRFIGVSDDLDLSTEVDVLALYHAFAQVDAMARARVGLDLERLRRAGTTILLASHEPDLLHRLCDEIWWLDGGKLAAKGDPRETLGKYRRHIAARMAEWGKTGPVAIDPALRHGDGRARIVALETLDARGTPTMVWRSGEAVSVRVEIRYEQAVEQPVIGMMVRNRIGMEVYGTNTELEGVAVGPVSAGETARLLFHFECGLCPQEYTLTVASHDPDGTAHDWLDDAVAFSVADSRYTAGVANLRAKVERIR